MLSRLELTLIGIVGLLLAFGGYTLYERHKGAQGCVQADVLLAAQQQVKDAQAQARSAIAQSKEDQARANALSLELAATPRVQPVAFPSRGCPVSKAAATPAARDGGAAVREPDAEVVVRDDWDAAIRSSVLIAHQCDIELKDRNELLKERQ